LATRRLVLAGALAVLSTSGLVLVSCARPGSGWTGGPVNPAPVRVTVNPSAMPIGDAVLTGVVIGTKEMILFLWGTREYPNLGTAWRDTRTGRVDENPPALSAAPFLDLGGGRIFGTDQLVVGDGTVVELGAVRGAAARIVSQPPGAEPVEAKYVRWSADPGIVIFWLRRAGPPIPSNHPVPGGSEPYAPERYPLISVYDGAGRVVAVTRIRPPADKPRMDG
jgi:hypothetical protein